MKTAYVLLMLVLIAACAPKAPSQTTTPETKTVQEPAVTTQEEVVNTQNQAQQNPPAIQQEEKEEEQSEQTTQEEKTSPYTELGCQQLLTTAEFSKTCDKNPDDLVVTYKVGSKNCLVNIKDRQNERLTAGITLTGYADGTVSAKEFDRRLVVMKLGADKSVGERAYTFKKLDRETVNFLRDEYITEVGSDTRLCSKEGVLAMAKTVDSKLK